MPHNKIVHGYKRQEVIRIQECKPPNGERIFVGAYEYDPCLYEEIERYQNVTVAISRCTKCGKITVDWYRQDDTVEVDPE